MVAKPKFITFRLLPEDRVLLQQVTRQYAKQHKEPAGQARSAAIRAALRAFAATMPKKG
jgi:hypothetical protein